jgi:hypothetical protein
MDIYLRTQNIRSLSEVVKLNENLKFLVVEMFDKSFVVYFHGS